MDAHFFPVTHISSCGQTQILPKKYTATAATGQMYFRHQSHLLLQDKSPGQTLGLSVNICVCLTLRFTYNDEMAHQKQFINSLSCSHYLEFQ